MKKSELGKGIKALLGNIGSEQESNLDTSMFEAKAEHVAISEIPIDEIHPNPNQPRNNFDETALQELAQSITTYGLIQPITIRKLSEHKYQIISGERRFRASKLAGLTSIPAYIRSAHDEEILALALVENIQREDLNPLEVALSYQRLLEELEITQDTLADRIGKNRSTISNYTRLLKLPPEVQQSLRDKSLSMGHARVLAGIDDYVKQIQIFRQIKQHELSVRETEHLVSKHHTISTSKTTTAASSTAIHPEVQKMQDQLSAKLGTKVQISRDQKGKGQIVIRFNSDNELNDIIDRLED